MTRRPAFAVHENGKRPKDVAILEPQREEATRKTAEF
jgi:hypothetical protein